MIRPFRYLPTFIALLSAAVLFAASPSMGEIPTMAPGATPASVSADSGSAMPADADGRFADAKEFTLDNGLRVVVLERDASPTFAAYYQFGVGGASDPRGRSGIAHLLEHMLFKGTSTVGTLDETGEKEQKLLDRLDGLWDQLHAELDKRTAPFATVDEERIAALESEIEEVTAEHKQLIVKNEYDELMTRAGGVGMNASTWFDRTNYFIMLPSNRLELWFELESNRLLEPVFREFYSERDVVHEERRLRTESNPQGAAFEALLNLMFTAHPYGTPVVGWPQDLMRLRREDALDYFETYYSPSNCQMVIVGDVDAEEVEKLAKKHFSAWKRQEIPPLPVTTEPEQQGERRRTVMFDAEPSLGVAWVTVPEGHADEPALDILSTVLGGLSSSRLERSAVQKERLASSISAFQMALRHGGFLLVRGELSSEGSAEELETLVEEEIARIQDSGITAEELERAKIQVEMRRVQGMKSNLGLAFEIASLVGGPGDLAYAEEQERRIDAVTAEQVADVARRYLTPDRQNVVRVESRRDLAQGPGGRGASHEISHQRGGTVSGRGAEHSTGFERGMKTIEAAKDVTLTVPEVGKDVTRTELSCGATLFIKEDHAAPSVEMAMTWTGGSNTTPVEDLAAFNVASQMLTEGGTKQLDPAAFEERREELGMRWWLFMSDTETWSQFWSLERNFEESFGLVMDALTEPRFDEQRFEVIKGQYVDRMRRRWDNPRVGAGILDRHVRLGDHPRLGYVPSRAEIEAVSTDDVRKVWRRYLGNDNLWMTVVGDFESADMIKHLESEVCGWREAEVGEREWIAYEEKAKPGVYFVAKDVAAPSVLISQPLDIDRTAPLEDHAAMEILNDILGGSGFRSRLMERLRSDEGLTYGIGSRVQHEGRPGESGRMRISYQTKQASVARSINSVLEEVRRVVSDEATPAEVQEQIEAWRNRFIFRFTNEFSSVNQLMTHELDDRSYDRDQRMLEAVQKVTVADVQRVADQYIKPENLMVAVFGALTDEDRKTLAEHHEVKELTKDEVFSGGYWDEAEEESTAEASASEVSAEEG